MDSHPRLGRRSLRHANACAPAIQCVLRVSTAGALDSRLRLPALRAATAGPSACRRPVGCPRLTVGVRCDSPAWTVYVPVTCGDRIEGAGDAPAAAAQRAPSQPGCGVCSSAACPASPPATSPHPDQLAGRHLEDAAAPGTALTTDLLAADILVRRGQRVTLVASVGGLEVRAQGEAVADATRRRPGSRTESLLPARCGRPGRVGRQRAGEPVRDKMCADSTYSRALRIIVNCPSSSGTGGRYQGEGNGNEAAWRQCGAQQDQRRGYKTGASRIGRRRAQTLDQSAGKAGSSAAPESDVQLTGASRQPCRPRAVPARPARHRRTAGRGREAAPGFAANTRSIHSAWPTSCCIIERDLRRGHSPR